MEYQSNVAVGAGYGRVTGQRTERSAMPLLVSHGFILVIIIVFVVVVATQGARFGRR
jgi:hypothetical protein